MKQKAAILAILISVSLISCMILTMAPSSAQSTVTCEQCGMDVDATGQARFRIVDASGSQHIACCPVCALRLQRTYDNLNITSFCDYYGPSYPIIIITRNNGTDVTVTPPDALIIAAGSCMKNRIVYNSTAADALLAPPDNGTSRWLSVLFNVTVAANATRLGIVQAALINGAGVPSSSPSISPAASPVSSPEPSNSLITTPLPSDTIIECEACGMDVTAESRARYKVTDGNGNSHYVECFMCALMLINDYETLHIETYCDWNGPTYPITVDTTNYGNGTFSVSPSTAVYLRGGSCITARAAYDQAAAVNLIANGYSQYTSPEQRYALPSNTEVMTVISAIETIYGNPEQTSNPTQLLLILFAAVGAVIVVVAIVAYRKLKK